MKSALIVGLFLLVACQQPEADSPEMQTSEAQQIGATSVVMETEIKQIGPVRPVNYGFFWDTQSDLTIVASKNRVILGSTSQARKFSIRLDNLTANTTYFYRGFAANADYSRIYYSNIVTFTTLP